MRPASAIDPCPAPRARRRIVIRGTVQGVGFRPFLWRLAEARALGGWVMNGGDGVVLEVEGDDKALDELIEVIGAAAPAHAVVRGIDVEPVPALGESAFTIRANEAAQHVATFASPDFATCADCLAELFEPTNRRYRYPFTTCTQCGPRFSVIESLPYERSRTSMRHFALCAACFAEYEDPASRRFHAETIACAECGPQLSLLDHDGRTLCTREAALDAAAAALRRGDIVAAKGIGGYHLLVDARNETAVQRLRDRKRRPRKPFATMFPSLAMLEDYCRLTAGEIALLRAPQAPIVLVRRRREREAEQPLAAAVAPGNPLLGAMLPYSPLHHLLLAGLGFPLVATSANGAGAPIAFDDRDALQRLAGVADLFLTHDRRILRPIDDSVARVVVGRPMILRRSRGYAPTPISHDRMRGGVLALGCHLKATAALSIGRDVVLSQHLGTLDTVDSRAGYERAVADLAHLHTTAPRVTACDKHPGYFTTRYAADSGLHTVPVQHHVAHVLAALAEHGSCGPALGIAWDGTGYGEDGSVWGGEFLHVDGSRYRRVAHFRTFRLPGGERAIREPRRSALGVLFELFGAGAFERTELAPVAAFTATERRVLHRALAREVNAPRTSSVGRLFDAVSALLGLCERSSYEGEAASMLEWALVRQPGRKPLRSRGYEFVLTRPAGGGDMPSIVDWAPAIERLIADASRGRSAAAVSAAFHAGLVESILAVASAVGEPTVVLTGGCFQNAHLCEAAVGALRRAGFTPLWHERVPPNDGGLALGQALFASLTERGD